MTQKTWTTIPPSAAFSYIMGVLKGDGYVTTKPYCAVGLGVKSEVFAEKFLKSTISIGLEPLLYYNSREIWNVIINNKLFVEWYKGLTNESYMNYVEKSKESFIQGVWDSEGSYSVRGATKYPNVIIGNTNSKMLTLVQQYLVEMNIQSSLTGPYQNKGCLPYYHLRIVGGREGVVRFFKIINHDVKGLTYERDYKLWQSLGYRTL